MTPRLQREGGKKAALRRALWVALAIAAVAATLAMRGPRHEARDWAAVYSRRRYYDPVDLKLSPHGRRLYVACEGRNEVLAINTASRRVIAAIPVGRRPKALALSPGGRRLFVANAWSGAISQIDTRALQVTRTLPAGWGVEGMAADRTGHYLYAANPLGNDISVIDLASGRETTRLAAGHFPEFAARLRGSWIGISNLLAQPAPPDTPPSSQLTLINAATRQVRWQVAIPGAVQMRHIAQTPPRFGGYLLIPFLQPHNLIPLIELRRDWYASNGLAIVQLRGRRAPRVREVLLDELDRAFANGYGAAVAPHTPWALITASGANQVAILNLERLHRLLQSPDADELARRLDAAPQFVARRLPTGRDPTAVAASPNGHFAYVANRADDTISVIDLAGLRNAGLIRLGAQRPLTARRRGQQLFFSALHSQDHEIACASCHPYEGFEDGLVWSFETPRLGRDVVENKTLLAIRGTSPFKWNGLNPNLATQDGPRTAMYIFRSQGFSPVQVRDLVAFINARPLPPNPHLAPGGLNPEQARGRALFFRTRTNTGQIIPLHDRCYYCHAPLTHFTSRVLMNVGTATRFDDTGAFKVPSLEGIYMRPPYLHNGEAQTLEEIWTRFNPRDRHGITSDMNKVQLNELIAYLDTL